MNTLQGETVKVINNITGGHTRKIIRQNITQNQYRQLILEMNIAKWDGKCKVEALLHVQLNWAHNGDGVEGHPFFLANLWVALSLAEKVLSG